MLQGELVAILGPSGAGQSLSHFLGQLQLKMLNYRQLKVTSAVI